MAKTKHTCSLLDPCEACYQKAYGHPSTEGMNGYVEGVDAKQGSALGPDNIYVLDAVQAVLSTIEKLEQALNAPNDLEAVERRNLKVLLAHTNAKLDLFLKRNAPEEA